MEKVVRIAAPAKINLHLRVYRRGGDGFHGLRSIFQAISLADEVIVRSLKKSNSIEILGDFDCPVEKTTFYKAILAWRRATGDTQGFRIEAQKHIPSGGGLGGGSSDAAAALRAFNFLSESPLDTAQLALLGAEVGSDVPFFLYGAAALVSGRGEIVEPIQARSDFGLLLCEPGFPSATPAAFALLDKERPDDSAEPDPAVARLLEAYYGPPAAWPFINSFEGPLFARYPVLGACFDALKQAGALFVRMSGSGSTLLGVFAGPDEARAAAASLGAKGPSGAEWLPVFPLARMQSVE